MDNKKFASGWRENRHHRLIEAKKTIDKASKLLGKQIKEEEILSEEARVCG